MSCARQCVRTLPMFRPQEELEFLTLVRTAASAYFFIERERGERERALRACTVYSRFTAVANASIVCHRLYDYHTERDNSEVANSFLMGQRSQARYRRQAVGKGKAGNLRKSARLVPPCATKESI